MGSDEAFAFDLKAPNRGPLRGHQRLRFLILTALYLETSPVTVGTLVDLLPEFTTADVHEAVAQLIWTDRIKRNDGVLSIA